METFGQNLLIQCFNQHRTIYLYASYDYLSAENKSMASCKWKPAAAAPSDAMQSPRRESAMPAFDVCSK